MSKLKQKTSVKNKYNWWVWDRFLSEENIKNINKIKSVSHKDDPATAKKTSKVKFLPFYKVNEYLQGAVERCYFSNMHNFCLLYTSPSPRDLSTSRMPSSA